MAETHETIADIIAEMRRRIAVKMSDAWYTQEEWRNLCDRLEAAHRREITILRDTLAELVASIEVRFPAIEYALDRKPYLDAKNILEQYKEEAALATTSNQTTKED